MRILALDAALARCSAAVLIDDTIVAECRRDRRTGEAALLPALASACLAAAGLRASTLDAVAATVGPGSFTGLRAALALAQGVAAAAGVALVGVTVAEALAEAVALPEGRRLWVAIDSRRAGRIFLAADGAPAAVQLSALPRPACPLALAGDAAPQAAAWLAARGADVMLTDVRLPRAADVARAAQRRLLGQLPPLAARPLYLDPPAARLPTESH
ncbi:MAG: tRNA (adenosine(37)-N6)-threonylcarbamoyltransferase complex dimerization subunit type 1 TsaB [Rhodospirillales bacterium]|nr:tRNA (adenosine(37)-N6)-threonylcarbamoyltransferase complex dimerization subunit type 1 TsaB [Rhodospirillales bacterium]